MFLEFIFCVAAVCAAVYIVGLIIGIGIATPFYLYLNVIRPIHARIRSCDPAFLQRIKEVTEGLFIFITGLVVGCIFTKQYLFWNSNIMEAFVAFSIGMLAGLCSAAGLIFLLGKVAALIHFLANTLDKWVSSHIAE